MKTVYFAPEVVHRVTVALLMAFIYCGCSEKGVSHGPAVLTDQPGWLGSPFPRAELQRADGSLNPMDYPDGGATAVSIANDLVHSFAKRLTDTVFGYGVNSSFYLRFDGPLDLPAQQTLERDADGPVQVYDCLANRCSRTGFRLFYIADGMADPFLPDHTLVITPRIGFPWPSGANMAVVVTSALRGQAGGAVKGPGVPEAKLLNPGIWTGLLAAGLNTDTVVTAFGVQVQGVVAELDAIRDTAAEWVDNHPLQIASWREVTRVEYRLGETPSGVEAAIMTARFRNGGSDRTDFETSGEDGYGFAVDITVPAFPFRVFEFRVRLPNYRGLEEAPYGSPGLAMLNDMNLRSGRIRLQRAGESYALLSTATAESVRLLLQLPVDSTGKVLPLPNLALWEHGTGGSAYNAVHRVSQGDDSLGVSKAFANKGYAILSRDQPLFGQRYPLYDQGYNSYLGAYNIANISAFRDYVRQAALEAFLIRRWLDKDFNQQLQQVMGTEAPTLKTERAVKFGHSLGAQMGNVSMVMSREQFPFRHAVLSGAGGIYSYFGLHTGMLNKLGRDDLALIRAFIQGFGGELDGDLTPANILGAAFGIPSAARDRLDVWHPLFSLFQALVDGGDPASYLPYYTVPETLVTGVGDYQVPNLSTDWIAAGDPEFSISLCYPRAGYDPHQCTFREQEGLAGVAAGLDAAWAAND